MREEILVGDIFGPLIVTGPAGERSASGKKLYDCKDTAGRAYFGDEFEITSDVLHGAKRFSDAVLGLDSVPREYAFKPLEIYENLSGCTVPDLFTSFRAASKKTLPLSPPLSDLLPMFVAIETAAPAVQSSTDSTRKASQTLAKRLDLFDHYLMVVTFANSVLAHGMEFSKAAIAVSSHGKSVTVLHLERQGSDSKTHRYSALKNLSEDVKNHIIVEVSHATTKKGVKFLR